MTEPGHAALAAALGEEPPSRLVASVDDSDLLALATALDAVRRAQADALAEALQHALEPVPRLMRGPLRRMFGG